MLSQRQKVCASPCACRDKRVVREPESEADIWWGEGSPNYEMDEKTFILNRERAVDYLNMLERLYVFDGRPAAE